MRIILRQKYNVNQIFQRWNSFIVLKKFFSYIERYSYDVKEWKERMFRNKNQNNYNLQIRKFLENFQLFQIMIQTFLCFLIYFTFLYLSNFFYQYETCF